MEEKYLDFLFVYNIPQMSALDDFLYFLSNYGKITEMVQIDSSNSGKILIKFESNESRYNCLLDSGYYDMDKDDYHNMETKIEFLGQKIYVIPSVEKKSYLDKNKSNDRKQIKLLNYGKYYDNIDSEKRIDIYKIRDVLYFGNTLSYVSDKNLIFYNPPKVYSLDFYRNLFASVVSNYIQENIDDPSVKKYSSMKVRLPVIENKGDNLIIYFTRSKFAQIALDCINNNGNIIPGVVPIVMFNIEVHE